MSRYEVMVTGLDTADVEAERFEIGSSLSGQALNNLTFYDDAGVVVAVFAQGSWDYVQRLTAEEVAARTKEMSGYREIAREGMN